MASIEDARRAQAAEAKRAAEIAKRQTEGAGKRGYRRIDGFAPAPRARSPYIPEAGRTVMQPSPPLDLSKAGEPKTKKTRFGVNE